jgi:tetratricopeptide (TPR) repeat protein
MKLNTSNTLAVACGLALVVSMPSGNVFARGSGGRVSGGHFSGGVSHSSSHIGMSHSSSHMTTRSHHVGRGTPTNGMNRVKNFRTNRTSRVVRGRKFSNRFMASRHRLYRDSTRKFSASKGPYWKKYGWGQSCGPWGCGFGWGWGSWYSPNCYGWCSYETLPVVAYYNPYCDCGNVVDGVDYSVPIASASATANDSDDSDAFATAREAFAQGNLDAALKAVSVAVLQTPHNPDVHQFHSLVLFAANNYCKSATVAHAVLEEGPGWTWQTLQTFYESSDAYTEQLRRLEHFVSEHPSDPNVRFLLGYHYLMLNHPESAERQLAQVVELEPKDKLVANILTGLKTEAPAKTAPIQTAPSKAAPSKTATVKSEPADIAPIQPVPSQNVPMQIVPTRAASAQAPTGKTEPVPVVEDEREQIPPAVTDRAKLVPIKGKSTTVEPAKVELAKDDSEKAQPAKGESEKAETAKVAPTLKEEEDESEEVETAKTEPVKRETAKVPTPTTVSDKTAKEAYEDEPTSDAKPAANEELVAEARGPAAPTTPITGTWKATPEKGILIELTLRDDKTFTWKFSANGKTQNFSGKYQVSAKSLVLTREDGEAMDGTLDRDGDASFKFRMKDADADDPGLNFSR